MMIRPGVTAPMPLPEPFMPELPTAGPGAMFVRGGNGCGFSSTLLPGVGVTEAEGVDPIFPRGPPFAESNWDGDPVPASIPC